MSTKMKDLPLFYAPALREELQLPEGEAQHALRVLRAKVGDEYLVTDGCVPSSRRASPVSTAVTASSASSTKSRGRSTGVGTGR